MAQRLQITTAQALTAHLTNPLYLLETLAASGAPGNKKPRVTLPKASYLRRHNLPKKCFGSTTLGQRVPLSRVVSAADLDHPLIPAARDAANPTGLALGPVPDDAAIVRVRAVLEVRSAGLAVQPARALARRTSRAKWNVGDRYARRCAGPPSSFAVHLDVVMYATTGAARVVALVKNRRAYSTSLAALSVDPLAFVALNPGAAGRLNTLDDEVLQRSADHAHRASLIFAVRAAPTVARRAVLSLAAEPSWRADRAEAFRNR